MESAAICVSFVSERQRVSTLRTTIPWVVSAGPNNQHRHTHPEQRERQTHEQQQTFPSIPKNPVSDETDPSCRQDPAQSDGYVEPIVSEYEGTAETNARNYDGSCE